jgi:tetratricopeptide (TPR) repeat protein
MRAIQTILVLALLIARARAQDEPAKPDTPEQAAEKVLAALKTEDPGALKALAGRDRPDPWLVADELGLRGKLEAAEAFARAAPRKDTEKLPAYVASHRSAPADEAVRAALVKATEALRSRDARGALAALDAVAGTEGTILAVRLRSIRAYALRGSRRYEESADAFVAAAAAAVRIGWIRLQGEALDRAGQMRWRTSHLPESLRLFRKRLEVEELRGDKSSMGGALMHVGLVLRKLGEYPEAIEASERAMKLKSDAGDAVAVARVLGNLGNVYANLGDYPRALKLQLESLEAKRRLGDRNREFLSLHNIGNLHATMGDFPRGLEANGEALEHARKLGVGREEARILASRASMYAEMGDFGRAIVLQERALDLWKDAKDRHGVGITLDNLARTHDKLGGHETALGYAERSLALRREIGDRRGESLSLSNLAAISSNLGDLPRARSFAEQALEIARNVGDPRALSGALINLAHIRLAQGDLSAALRRRSRASRRPGSWQTGPADAGSWSEPWSGPHGPGRVSASIGSRWSPPGWPWRRRSRCSPDSGRRRGRSHAPSTRTSTRREPARHSLSATCETSRSSWRAAGPAHSWSRSAGATESGLPRFRMSCGRWRVRRGRRRGWPSGTTAAR